MNSRTPAFQHNPTFAGGCSKGAGHSVLAAVDGAAALAPLDRNQIDLILLDVQMPLMDGLQAAATGRHLPIFAMTAFAMEGDRERCLAAGMDGYLAKPIQPDKLYAVLDAAGAGLKPESPHV